ncbi:MAG: quinolinate synthase NadA [candidate division Zixibacteria bacterium]|nr:quinolinate synthase NadA [candidate division Zixibacteria bacterium]
MHFTVPDKYRAATLPELSAFVMEAKRRYGRRMIILAHHYQRLEVTEVADFIGDSYELSRVASERNDAEHIVFCGVHFMAESADILSADYQKVYLPNPLAGCPMADMADIDDVLTAWQRLVDLGLAERTLPLSYMNSAAELKAFCGRQGGLICTSSNAKAAFDYVYARADKLFFFPDENLGYNVGRRMGIPDDQIVVWNFRADDGGIDADRLRKARLILWKGHCHVHTNFKPEHVAEVRRRFPGVKVVVHPECVWDVVAAADAVGSTKFIVDYIGAQPPGSIIAVGTEINLINRMAHAHPDKRIFELSGQTCPVCANMYRTTMADLANTVENLDVFDRIVVRDEIKADARLALNRMLEVH